MPSNVAPVVQHYPKHSSVISNIEAARRCDTSINAFRRAVNAAHCTTAPTTQQRILLHLPLHDEERAYFAWRTTLLDLNHTSRHLDVPGQFREIFRGRDRSHLFLPPASRHGHLIATKRNELEGAIATLKIRYTADSFDEAELEWRDRTERQAWHSDAWVVNDMDTILTFPFMDILTTRLIKWPGTFSDWIEDVLLEFVIDSVRSRDRKKGFRQIWENAERAAEANGATAVTDDEVDAGLRSLPGNVK